MKRILTLAMLMVVTLSCSILKPAPAATVTPTSASNPQTSTPLPTEGVVSPDKPFELIGVWKSDNLHAPDNSWDMKYSVYFQFTDTKQNVYHGADTFNKNQPTDVSEIVYLNINDSTFIKKLVNIPDHPELLGKFQKWTWRFDNEKVQFTVYGTMDSQDQALNDKTITGLATGVKVQPQTEAQGLTDVSKPAANPFTGELSSGIWDGAGKINNKGALQISFIIDKAAVSRWQVTFNDCSKAIGDKQDFAIKNGLFSLTFDNPCYPGETVKFNGVFTSATEIAGTIQAGSDSGEWTAKFTE